MIKYTVTYQQVGGGRRRRELLLAGIVGLKRQERGGPNGVEVEVVDAVVIHGGELDQMMGSEVGEVRGFHKRGNEGN